MLWKALKGFCLPPRVLLGLSFSSSLVFVEKNWTFILLCSFKHFLVINFSVLDLKKNCFVALFIAIDCYCFRLCGNFSISSIEWLIWFWYEPICVVLRGQGSFSLKTESSPCPQSHHLLYVLYNLYHLLSYAKTVFSCFLCWLAIESQPKEPMIQFVVSSLGWGYISLRYGQLLHG